MAYSVATVWRTELKVQKKDKKGCGQEGGNAIEVLPSLLDLLVFNSITWPTTMSCTVTGEDDITVSDTTKLSAILHYRITVQ